MSSLSSLSRRATHRSERDNAPYLCACPCPLPFVVLAPWHGVMPRIPLIAAAMSGTGLPESSALEVTFDSAESCHLPHRIERPARVFSTSRPAPQPAGSSSSGFPHPSSTLLGNLRASPNGMRESLGRSRYLVNFRTYSVPWRRVVAQEESCRSRGNMQTRLTMPVYQSQASCPERPGERKPSWHRGDNEVGKRCRHHHSSALEAG